MDKLGTVRGSRVLGGEETSASLTFPSAILPTELKMAQLRKHHSASNPNHIRLLWNYFWRPWLHWCVQFGLEMTMKRILFLAAVFGPIVLAAPVSAADLAARPYVKAPPPVVAPIYDWSGFYVGANAGYGWSDRCLDVTAISGLAVADAEGCRNAGGGIAGGQIGYRWQWSNVVFGLEAQGDWANLRNSNASLVFPGDTWSTKTNALGLFTGQIGYAWNNALWYVKGGAAVANQRWDLFNSATGVGIAQAERSRWGGTVGTGFEYGFAPNWSVGIEYDFLFRTSDSQTFVTPGLAPITSITSNTRSDINMITARINYRFGGYGAPIAARY